MAKKNKAQRTQEAAERKEAREAKAAEAETEAAEALTEQTELVTGLAQSLSEQEQIDSLLGVDLRDDSGKLLKIARKDFPAGRLGAQTFLLVRFEALRERMVRVLKGPDKSKVKRNRLEKLKEKIAALEAELGLTDCTGVTE